MSGRFCAAGTTRRRVRRRSVATVLATEVQDRRSSAARCAVTCEGLGSPAAKMFGFNVSTSKALEPGSYTLRAAALDPQQDKGSPGSHNAMTAIARRARRSPSSARRLARGRHFVPLAATSSEHRRPAPPGSASSSAGTTSSRATDTATAPAAARRRGKIALLLPGSVEPPMRVLRPGRSSKRPLATATDPSARSSAQRRDRVRPSGQQCRAAPDPEARC